MNSYTTFSLTEEAFLLRSLKEVVNVWARGTGQASFNLNISNGSADLQLGFQLGLPTEPHLHTQHQHEPVICPKPQQSRRKSPSRRRRDRERAAQHQAATHQPAQAKSSSTSDKAEVEPTPVIILPFNGKLIPLHPQDASTPSCSLPLSPLLSNSQPSPKLGVDFTFAQ